MGERQWRRSLGIASILAVMLALIGAGAISVSAHARLTASVPAKDATVTTAPTQVLLTFSQETSATLSNGSVVNASGATVSTGFKVDLNQRTNMSIALQPNLPNGVYTVKFHTLTEDDNGMVDDSFNFTLQAAQQAATAAPSGTTPAGTTTTTGSPTSGTAAATATTAPTATRAATTPAAGSATTTSATSAATATRSSASAVATGIGGATLPTTGNPGGDSGTPWLWIVVIAGSLALVAGYVLRRGTHRAT